MKKKKENNDCIDAMLWIGNDPRQYQSVDEFVKEARLRGCCRRLPFVPGWMKSGEIRVFLAHRDNHKTSKRGSVFGYFVLHRIEIIAEHKVAQSLSETKNIDSLWPHDIKVYDTCIKQWKQEKCTHDEIIRRVKEKLQREHLPKVAKGKTDAKPSSEDYDDNTLQLIEDTLNTLLNNCFPWQSEKNDDDTLQLIEDILDILICMEPDCPTGGEGHRMCSLRKGPGSVYAVDALCAAVHVRYRELLQDRLAGKSDNEIRRNMTNIKKENDQAWTKWLKYRKNCNYKWNIEELLKHYTSPFREAVKELYGHWTPVNSLDPRLNGKVSRHGELIVFNKPYPILEKAPQAAFKGITYIDGDKLIEQIGVHDGKGRLILKIYTGKNGCPDNQPLKTKAQLVTYLSRELRLNKVCANRFLDELALTTKNQLLHFGWFRVPSIGTIRCQGKREPKIKFFPAKALSAIGPAHKIKFYQAEAISKVCSTHPPRMKLKRIKTKKDLSAKLAGPCQVNNALANRFLNELSQIAGKQLKDFQKFKLPRIGTIRI